MKYLIVTADDFGLTEEICDGIIEAYSRGVVRSASLIANGEFFDYAVGLLKDSENLGVGVHLNATVGKPILSDVKTLTDAKRNFLGKTALLKKINEISISELEQEFEAQIEKVIAAGIDVTFLNSHHRIHNNPVIHEVVCSLAKKYDIAIRKNDNPCEGVKTTESFSDVFFNESATPVNFKMIVKKYSSYESLEIMCHPAFHKPEIFGKKAYKYGETELTILCSSDIEFFLKNEKIEVINFAQLP